MGEREMKKYIGVKLINAAPMTRQAYNDLRGLELPDDEDGSDEGFLVEYVDGGKPNTEEYAGYVSWSPGEVFQNAYKETQGLNFGLAIEAMKKGFKVARSGWSYKVWLRYVAMDWYDVLKSKFEEEVKTGPEWNLEPWIAIKTADDKFGPWLASQSDMLADDWLIVE